MSQQDATPLITLRAKLHILLVATPIGIGKCLKVYSLTGFFWTLDKKMKQKYPVTQINITNDADDTF